jgi:hypothetical protein
MLNELDYGSLDACQRLQDAGIEVETEIYWKKLVTGQWRLSTTTAIPGTGEESVPALSMAEAWRMLLFRSKNPTDCLIDLLIWIEEKEK